MTITPHSKKAGYHMHQFRSIEIIDTGILYLLELASSLSVLLLAFGLIASMANVLTKGSVLTDNLFMQRVWAWTQCIAIDASVAGTIIRTFRFYQEGERIKAYLYTFLSALLLFTAAIVSNIEAVQQTLNTTLDVAYTHVFVPVEVLIWIRSLAIVLLIVAHAMRHVQRTSVHTAPTPHTVVIPQEEPERTPEALPQPKDEQKADNFERVKAYMNDHPSATVREVAKALQISATTSNKWMSKANVLSRSQEK
jgi:hypothetical protein